MSRITPRKKFVIRYNHGVPENVWSELAKGISAVLLGNDQAGREIQRKEEYRKTDELFRNPRRIKHK